MGKYSIDEFIDSTGQRDLGEGTFELERDRLLEINLEGKVWTKMGSMVAYLGDIKFTREGVMEHGIGKMLKKAVTGEGV
ncbi:MAG: AIM24 family protein, partial [Methanosarcinales archaeon]|nr:AIM24 family protein [Methanosarcinales archaeon]